jgi:hypothetical protein
MNWNINETCLSEQLNIIRVTDQDKRRRAWKNTKEQKQQDWAGSRSLEFKNSALNSGATNKYQIKIVFLKATSMTWFLIGWNLASDFYIRWMYPVAYVSNK